MLDKYTHISLLYDFYGSLLTKKQQEILSLYHGDNYSLSEIAEELGISRQGVHATLKSGESALLHYESDLRLVQKYDENRKAVEILGDVIAQAKAKGEKEIQVKLQKVMSILDRNDG